MPAVKQSDPVAQSVRWTEEEGIIYFPLTSDGTTGPEWIERLENKDYRVGDYAKQLLQDPAFIPTTGVTYRLGVIRASLFSGSERVTKKIRTYAVSHRFLTPPAEIAPLIREYLSDKELERLGLWWIVAMHEPIKDSDGNPNLLDVRRYDGGQWLNAYWDYPDDPWDDDGAFAFLVPQE